ncbi:J domain-containing protein [Oxynema aestuarii]|jgi:molecular chaperone DnaJ|uniref:J domain-containing protein n=1 Tax=Oxynema aestuarii AP17 TaxID=2064643 RepID=A0A6H1U007_9CYAN|nr:DnaJ domain-containing protein [Oxynema aestuarii]QIZ71500.1 J domain-containing protein [Oxynema aestuarii AP17]RMH74520.1 MAG: J domain-containing protein [Cyanobacteria bacterium J007]
MTRENYYQTLGIDPQATPAQIKQAYRRLAKQFHPDRNRGNGSHEQIIRINAAYEILGDPEQRQNYDRARVFGGSRASKGDRQQRTADAQRSYHEYRQSTRNPDEHLQQWLKQVYRPVNHFLARILSSLDDEIDELAADPFDDELLGNFQEYLDICRNFLAKAQHSFRSMPNPSNVAGVAAHLYHCLNQVGDGIDELEFFTFNYDEHYLHRGQELFRIAAGLRREAHAAMKQVW